MKIFDGYHVSVENGPADRKTLTAARRLVTKARRVSDARGLTAYRDYQELTDGTQIYVLRHGDIARTHIVMPPAEQEQSSFKSLLPDFVSGVTASGTIETAANGSTYLSKFYPTPTTRLRAKLSEGPVDIARLAIRPDPLRDDWTNPSSSPNAKPYAQVMACKPTMYSGKMKKVVQFLLGVGRPNAPPGPFDAMYTAALKKIAPTVSRDDSYDWGTRLRNVYNAGMKVVYDNRFYRTHGIAKATDGKLWLVQISPSGVYAMPLPLWPFTDSTEFRRRVENAKFVDDELLTVLDEFGGVPSGGSFPGRLKGEFDAWVRAGKVVKLMSSSEVAGPYAMQPFSTACGWAFNESGTEAHNVMYEFGVDDFLYTEHWHFQFSIGTEIAKQTTTQAKQNRLAKLLAGAKAPSLTYKGAVLSKLPWVEESALDSFIALARSSGAQAGFNALDQHVVVRYNASCSLGRSSHEIAWHPGRYLKAPAPMKFWEPLLRGIINVNLNKLGFQWQWNKGSPPEIIDALMYVYFIGDELNFVRYYYEWNHTYKTESEDNFEECMYSGSWEKTERTGTQQPAARFYHTKLDPRELNTPELKKTRIKSMYYGVTPMAIGDDMTYLSRGWATRVHLFVREEWIDWYFGGSTRSACIVPAWVREGVLFGVANEKAYSAHIYTRTYPGMTDPWWYEYTRWFGTWKFGPNGIIGGGGWPATTTKCGYHYERKVVAEYYSPTNCSDIVDQGPWLSECQVAAPSAYTPPTGSGVVSTQAYDQRFRVYADYPPLQGLELVYEHNYDPNTGSGYRPWDANWFYPSPDEYGTIQNAGALYNCLGSSDRVVGSTGPDSYGPGINRGTPNKPNDVWNFVGVVDGN